MSELNDDMYEVWKDDVGTHVSFEYAEDAEGFLDHLSTVEIAGIRIPYQHPFTYCNAKGEPTVTAPEVLSDHDEEWIKKELDNYREDEPNSRVIL